LLTYHHYIIINYKKNIENQRSQKTQTAPRGTKSLEDHKGEAVRKEEGSKT